MADEPRILFIGGLHKSGTSLLHGLLRTHPDVSGFSATGVPEDEGQHLQSLYPPAYAHGGPGRFAFAPEAHLDEASALATPDARARLWREWSPHWDLSKRLLIEKSPPNLIRSRFLQALFPQAKFVFIVRHPLAVARATRKWTDQSLAELVDHWTAAHNILLADLPLLRAAIWIRFEDLIAAPEATLQGVWRFAKLSDASIPATIDTASNDRYLIAAEADGPPQTDAAFARTATAFGYSPWSAPPD